MPRSNRPWLALAGVVLVLIALAVLAPAALADTAPSPSDVGAPPTSDDPSSGAGLWAWILILGFGTTMGVVAGYGASRAREHAEKQQRRPNHS